MTDAHVHTIRADTTGRYLVARAEGNEPAPLLVGFHGYAENADVHLEQLRRIPNTAHWHRVAVQALHRFYHPKTQDVIGSWMTRLDREQAIVDNAAYVKSVLLALRRDYAVADTCVVLGFSQGASMAWRAAAAAATCDGVIALGGDMPPDVAADPSAALPRALIARGNADSFYTADKLEADLLVLKRLSVPVEVCVFDGGHEWSDPFRDAASRFLAVAASEPRKRSQP